MRRIMCAETAKKVGPVLPTHSIHFDEAQEDFVDQGRRLPRVSSEKPKASLL
jgi:hypothetical protein